MRLCLLITASAFVFLLSSCGVQEITKKNEVVTTQELSNDFQNTPITSIDMSATKSVGDDVDSNIQQKVNPDEIATIINNGDKDIKVLWDKLKIESTYEIFDDTSVKLNAEVIKIDLGEDNSEIKILKVCDSNKYNGQLMFFKNSKGEWIFCGSIEDTSLRGNDIQYEIIECGDKKMIQTTYSAGRGTGFSRTESAVYSIIDNKLQKVLVYPNDEHSWQSPSQELFYRYDGDIESCWKDEKNYFIEISYNVTYTNPKVLGSEIGTEKKYDLFEYTPTILFYWDNVNKKFTIDKIKSGKYNFNNQVVSFSFTQDEFVEYFVDELKKMAMERDVLKLEWLNNFIDGCGDSKEKDEIVRILKNEQTQTFKATDTVEAKTTETNKVKLSSDEALEYLIKRSDDSRPNKGYHFEGVDSEKFYVHLKDFVNN
jgi:hypothetical protein